MPQYPASFDLQALTPANGYVIRSGQVADWFSLSVASAGDVNDDGFADFLFGAPGHHLRENRPNPPVIEGTSYLVFGGAGRLATLDLLDGNADGIIDLSLMSAADGYSLAFGSIGDASGAAVAGAGNQDGIAGDDLLIGTPRTGNGRVTLVSGGASLALLDAADGSTDGAIDLTLVDGTTGYQFDGRASDDAAGIDVASGPDLDGDGQAEILVGAHNADQPGQANAGEAAVIFGGATKLAALDAADGLVDGRIAFAEIDGSNGYILQGVLAGDNAGFRVRGLKDVNGDGKADIMVGAYQTPAAGLGEAYLVFGDATNLAVLDVAGGAPLDGRISLGALNGTTGYRFESADDGDQMGLAISSAGDVNADGIEDMLIGDPFSDPFAVNNSGDAYLVFGGAASLATLDAADGTTDGVIDLDFLNGVTGFRISGAGSEWVGQSVAEGGDINGDGYGDIIVGANFRTARQGAVYVLFGGTGLAIEDAADGAADGRIRMASFSGVGGFRLDGVDAQDQAGFAVSGVPDIDGDGMNEVMIGGVRDNSTVAGVGDGEAYLFFSRLPDAAVQRAGTAIGQLLVGGNFGDSLSGLGGNDDLRGNGGADTLDGGTGADTMAGGAAADRYTVDNALDRVIEGAAGGTDTVLARISYTLEAGQQIEEMQSFGAATSRTLTGNEFANRLTGWQVGDTLNGEAGNDTLLGQAGADTLNGGAGDDFLYVDALDALQEAIGGGTDRAITGVDFALTPGAEVEFLIAKSGVGGLALTGNDLVNTLVGNTGGDTLLGGAGNDGLRGNGGNDRLDGGFGIDLVTGGAGADTVVLSADAAHRDVVSGFTAGLDRLEASAASFGGGLAPGALAAAAFRSNATGLAEDADDRFLYSTTNGALYFDVDGLGGAARVAAATLNTLPALGAADFIIVA